MLFERRVRAGEQLREHGVLLVAGAGPRRGQTREGVFAGLDRVAEFILPSRRARHETANFYLLFSKILSGPRKVTPCEEDMDEYDCITGEYAARPSPFR